MSTCLDSFPEAEAATGAVFPRVETSASLDSSTEAEAALGCREGGSEECPGIRGGWCGKTHCFLLQGGRVRGMSMEGRLVR